MTGAAPATRVAPSAPLTVLTGFLGAGKTTLLGRALADPALAGAAVLINEVGEVAIDHHLVREVGGGRVVLASGCVCCAIQGDLVRALRELRAAQDAGAAPPTDRVLLETTGLADPTAVLTTLATHPAVATTYHAAAVVTAVDGVVGLATLERHREALAQAVVADRLVITKVDAATPAGLAALDARLATVAPFAPRLHAAHGAVPASVLLAPAASPAERARLLARPLADPAAAHPGVRTFVETWDHPVRLDTLGLWLAMVTQLHGPRLLRVKGLVAGPGDAAPHVVHAVQHLVYPPAPLPAWPDGDRRGRLVFVTHGLGDGALATLRAGLREVLAPTG